MQFIEASQKVEDLCIRLRTMLGQSKDLDCSSKTSRVGEINYRHSYTHFLFKLAEWVEELEFLIFDHLLCYSKQQNNMESQTEHSDINNNEDEESDPAMLDHKPNQYSIKVFSFNLYSLFVSLIS